METARRVVVVTGAGGAIGRASAVAIGRQGVYVALLAGLGAAPNAGAGAVAAVSGRDAQ